MSDLNTARDKDKGVSARQQMASSCVGSLLVSVFMTPLDVVKVRLQAQERFFSKKCFLYSNGFANPLLGNASRNPMALHTMEEICNCRWYHRPKFYNGTIDAMFKISKAEGITSLWSGLIPALLLAVPMTVTYFTAYDQFKGGIKKIKGGEVLADQAWVSLSCGALARVWAVTMVSPLELVRTKMQSQKMGFGEVRQVLSETVKSQGVVGLWRGYSATLLRDVPFSALYWPCYEYLKPQTYNFQETFLAGAMSGTLASVLTHPMDVVKTRLQIELGDKMSSAVAKSNFTVAMEMISTEGLVGLFTGLVPRIVKVAPACAIMISSYEHGKRFFSKRNKLAEKENKFC